MALNTLPSKAPNLPSAPTQYDARFQEQFSNALRLYFTRIDSNNLQDIQSAANVSSMQWLDGGCY